MLEKVRTSSKFVFIGMMIHYLLIDPASKMMLLRKLKFQK